MSAGSAETRRLFLDTPVTYLKGVGPKRAEALLRLNIATAGDLLFHVPHRYEDASTVASIASLEPGMDATVIGQVVSKGVIPTRKGLRIFQAVLRDGTGMIEVSWPGQPYLDRQIQKGETLLVTGSVRFFHGRQMQPREFVNLGDDDEGTSGGRVLSVYPATEGLGVKAIRALIDGYIDQLLPLVVEYLPPSAVARARVPLLPAALRMVHRPTSIAEAEEGRSRLAFEELLFVQILMRRANALARARRNGIAFENRRDLTSRLKGALPFELTGAQVRSLREIFADMCSDRRMHRLLQGDVGSGKTIVALFAALLALENGRQAAIMAPTELLAEQHLRTFVRLLAPFGIVPLLLTGRLPARERREAAERMALAAPLLVVGTHALVQDATTFARLGLAVIDEQHRFGVEQRKALGGKGERPDVLLMSATPIPRSLALTLYGDLDVTVIDELPAGRLPVPTRVVPAAKRPDHYRWIVEQVGAGRQAYIVCPLVEGSESVQARAAEDEADHLAAGPLSEVRVGCLHGQLPAAERLDVMRRFAGGALDVLVATTVIEVGVDVPNASVMVVEDADRFGLAQLHQLRGRVGRGSEQSYCFLYESAEPTDEGRARLKALVEHASGFDLAEIDLEMRGEGHLLGRLQSGRSELRHARLSRDRRLLEEAREDARTLLDGPGDPVVETAADERFGAVIAGLVRG